MDHKNTYSMQKAGIRREGGGQSARNMVFGVQKRCSKGCTGHRTMAGGSRPWGIKGRVGPSKGGTFPCTTSH
jgi:hypothetical protein